MFSNPTSPPGVPMGLVMCRVQCVSAYILSSPSFKGVTRGMDFIDLSKRNVTLIIVITALWRHTF